MVELQPRVLPTHEVGRRGPHASVSPFWAEERSGGLRPWCGERYSHKLKGGQLIKDPRLQTGEDVSRYVSAGGREQSDRILGSLGARGEG